MPDDTLKPSLRMEETGTEGMVLDENALEAMLARQRAAEREREGVESVRTERTDEFEVYERADGMPRTGAGVRAQPPPPVPRTAIPPSRPLIPADDPPGRPRQAAIPPSRPLVPADGPDDFEELPGREAPTAFQPPRAFRDEQPATDAPQPPAFGDGPGEPRPAQPEGQPPTIRDERPAQGTEAEPRTLREEPAQSATPSDAPWWDTSAPAAARPEPPQADARRRDAPSPREPTQHVPRDRGASPSHHGPPAPQDPQRPDQDPPLQGSARVAPPPHAEPAGHVAAEDRPRRRPQVWPPLARGASARDVGPARVEPGSEAPAHSDMPARSDTTARVEATGPEAFAAFDTPDRAESRAPAPGTDVGAGRTAGPEAAPATEPRTHAPAPHAPPEAGAPGDGCRIAVVQAAFNAEITDMMADLAVSHAKKAGADVAHHVKVPGVYDLPLTVQRLARRKDVDAVVVIGCVVQGETRHDELITHATAKTLQEISLATETPIGLGIIGPGMTWAQAEARVVNGKHAVEAVLVQWAALQRP